jgi:glycosyltransferase involved in cell wall biosynthesis
MRQSSDFAGNNRSNEQQLAVTAAKLWDNCFEVWPIDAPLCVGLCYFQWDSPVRQAFHPKKTRNLVMNKVSILIPAYNAERFVGAALQSALDQTWPHTEIIVVDDGSKDQTYAIAKRYESAKVKILRQQNCGAAAARNTALRQAHGDFLQYIDADDLLSPDKISEQVLLLRQHPGYISVSSAMYFFDGEDFKAGLLERSAALDSDDPVAFLAQLLGSEGPIRTIPYGAWLTPRAVADAAGPWDDTLRSPDDDGEYFSRVMLASQGIRASHTGCYYYRRFRQGGSYSTTLSESNLRGRLHSLNSKSGYLLARTQDPKAYRALANRYMDLAFVAYPDFPQVTNDALLKAREMGGTDYIPAFGTWKGDALKNLLGWRAARRLNATYHRTVGRLRALANT